METLLSASALIMAFAVLSAVGAQEKKLARKDLPKAVEAAVTKESAGAEIKGFSKEKEKGVLTYEVELIVNGHSKDIAMDARGNILEVEEDVMMDSLSDAVRAGLKGGAGNGTISKIESLTRKGTLVGYEATVVIGKKHREIQVGSEGQKLPREL